MICDSKSNVRKEKFIKELKHYIQLSKSNEAEEEGHQSVPGHLEYNNPHLVPLSESEDSRDEKVNEPKMPSLPNDWKQIHIDGNSGKPFYQYHGPDRTFVTHARPTTITITASNKDAYLKWLKEAVKEAADAVSESLEDKLEAYDSNNETFGVSKHTLTSRKTRTKNKDENWIEKGTWYVDGVHDCIVRLGKDGKIADIGRLSQSFGGHKVAGKLSCTKGFGWRRKTNKFQKKKNRLDTTQIFVYFTGIGCSKFSNHYFKYYNADEKSKDLFDAFVDKVYSCLGKYEQDSETYAKSAKRTPCKHPKSAKRAHAAMDAFWKDESEDDRRRMAQRTHSSRRDSPVMVRLLQEIVAAQDK